MTKSGGRDGPGGVAWQYDSTAVFLVICSQAENTRVAVFVLAGAGAASSRVRLGKLPPKSAEGIIRLGIWTMNMGGQLGGMTTASLLRGLRRG